MIVTVHRSCLSLNNANILNLTATGNKCLILEDVALHVIKCKNTSQFLHSNVLRLNTGQNLLYIIEQLYGEWAGIHQYQYNIIKVFVSCYSCKKELSHNHFKSLGYASLLEYEVSQMLTPLGMWLQSTCHTGNGKLLRTSCQWRWVFG